MGQHGSAHHLMDAFNESRSPHPVTGSVAANSATPIRFRVTRSSVRRWLMREKCIRHLQPARICRRARQFLNRVP